MIKSRLITAIGLVQGIGFRPFIYKTAQQLSLTGWVENRTDSVEIHVEGAEGDIDSFIAAIRDNPPTLSRIDTLESRECPSEGATVFNIRQSADLTDRVTDVSPDIAVCEHCLADMANQKNRLHYPFVNCTLCGPRFSIIKALPYDRSRTTMENFVMCDSCRAEYENIEDRRFHAQPVACNDCGPGYRMRVEGREISDIEAILDQAAKMVAEGNILTVRGLGGYHFVCDALSEVAVCTLRKRKIRDSKPFAVMFHTIDTLREFAEVSAAEEGLLLSAQRPIVILTIKKSLASGVSQRLTTVGAMLPYLPFHYLLFERLDTPALVMTSGNFSDEPIVIGNEAALRDLGAIADATITHNRDIHNRVDDSVAFVVNETQRLIRRSRGYVPRPQKLNLDVDGIFAAGAELKNCFALGKGDRAIVSQHIGDLKTAETLAFYEESIGRFKSMFRVEPVLAVCDIHPDYLSTRFAQGLGLPITTVQHHHAHIASCMAEHELDRKVIGVSLDGIGYGDDGSIWGGEFLVADLAGFERVNYLEPVAMPGGDKASKEPWRMAVAYLYQTYGEDLVNLDIPLVRKADPTRLEIVLSMLKSGLNCPLTSSAGRLFDAVSAMTGICGTNSFEAEAAMLLESRIEGNERGCYPFRVEKMVHTGHLIEAIVDDIKSGTPAENIAAKFHNTVVKIIVDVCERTRAQRGLEEVCLSGGVFQNRCILQNSELALRSAGFSAFSHALIPSNDGGIALGQLAVAAKRRVLSCV